MKIFGIDPALACLGWGLIESKSNRIYYRDSGVIKTSPNTPLHHRLADITEQIDALSIKYDPDAFAMEETFLNVNTQSSFKLAYVRGAIMSVIGKKHVPYYEYLPNKIKKTVVGTGHASKDQIEHMINILLSGAKNSKLTHDETDALAVAYSCLVIEYNKLSH